MWTVHEAKTYDYSKQTNARVGWTVMHIQFQEDQTEVDCDLYECTTAEEVADILGHVKYLTDYRNLYQDSYICIFPGRELLGQSDWTPEATGLDLDTCVSQADAAAQQRHQEYLRDLAQKRKEARQQREEEEQKQQALVEARERVELDRLLKKYGNFKNHQSPQKYQAIEMAKKSAAHRLKLANRVADKIKETEEQVPKRPNAEKKKDKGETKR